MKTLAVVLVVSCVAAPQAEAANRDLFVKVIGERYETCWGIPWETERGNAAAVDVGKYITNRRALRCVDQITCSPNECYFVGSLAVDDEGKVLWFAAPRSSYPPNISLLGLAVPVLPTERPQAAP